MTREELAHEVRHLTGSAKFAANLAYGGWSTILKPAAMTGRLCFGPSIGQRVRFTHLRTWVTMSAPQMDSQTATATVTRRFLSAYGPATYHDLARWWSGSGTVTSRQWITALGEEVCPIELGGGVQSWMLTSDAHEAREFRPQRSVRLIPAFHQHLIGASRHAEHLLPGNFRSRVYRPQGWISPVLLVNGLTQGVWRHKVKGSCVEVFIEPFVEVPAWVRRAAEHEAERLAVFLGGKLILAWKS